MEWPTNRDGEKLKMLAQINLSELPENEFLSAHGLLQFFIGDDDLMGLEFESEGQSRDSINKEQSQYRVVYHSDLTLPKADLLEYQPLESSEYSPIAAEYSIEFVAKNDSATPTDYRWNAVCEGLPEPSDATDEAIYEGLH